MLSVSFDQPMRSIYVLSETKQSFEIPLQEFWPSLDDWLNPNLMPFQLLCNPITFVHISKIFSIFIVCSRSWFFRIEKFVIFMCDLRKKSRFSKTCIGWTFLHYMIDMLQIFWMFTTRYDVHQLSSYHSWEFLSERSIIIVKKKSFKFWQSAWGFPCQQRGKRTTSQDG